MGDDKIISLPGVTVPLMPANDLSLEERVDALEAFVLQQQHQIKMLIEILQEAADAEV